MELPRRPRGDELLTPGALTDLRHRLRATAAQHDLATVIACAFDHRTRMLPFIFADTRMAPAGVRAIGSALLDCGFDQTRIVLQQWNRRFRPRAMRLAGRTPDLFMVSSMGLHYERSMQLMRDAQRIDEADRPLVIAGGPNCVYAPWSVFNTDPAQPSAADVAVTGEEYILLRLLEVILDHRAAGESMRAAFRRARDAGALDEVPGLMYARGDHPTVPDELIDTGVQQLLSDLDELPDPVLGYRILEPPSRRESLADAPVPPQRIRKLSPISSLVMTFGCKFACPYCPIPGYNQRQHRLKSGDRIAEDMARLHSTYGLRYFFGADDNFFNDADRALDIVDAIARKQVDGKPLRRRVRWYTEVTVHDTLKVADHLPAIRDAGCRALWLGVEDMTGTLVKKGQSVDKTTDAFRRLAGAGICPMPMMMHHDTQPLYTTRGDYGLINQVRLLRRAGAVSLQVLMITPSAGSKLYESTFTTGQVYDRVAGLPVTPHMYDGNYVVASRHPKPWRKQLSLLAAYAYFYNPIALIGALLFRSRSRLGFKPAGMQLIGMLGLTQTIRRTIGWAARLALGPIHRLTRPPASTLPVRPAADPAKPQPTITVNPVEPAHV